MFLSLQNYLGKMRNSTETKERIKKLSSVDWDLVVLDEYHFGAWNRRTQSTIDVKNEYEEMDEEYLRDLRGDIIKKFHVLYAMAVLHIAVVALASEKHIGTDWTVGRNGEPVLFYFSRRIDL